MGGKQSKQSVTEAGAPAELGPNQWFPKYEEWKNVYERVKNTCDWPLAFEFLEKNPECINNRKQDLEGWTLLHQAAFWGCDKGVIQRLKDCGADPNLKDSRGMTPADVGVAQKKTDFVAAMRNIYGPGDLIGRNQLSKAAKEGQFVDVIRLLTECPHLANNQSNTGWSIMHQLAFHAPGQGLIRRLLTFGCSPALFTHRGEGVAQVIIEYHGEDSLCARNFEAVLGKIGEAAPEAPALRLEVGTNLQYHGGKEGVVKGKAIAVSESEVTMEDSEKNQYSGPRWRFGLLPAPAEGDGLEGLSQCAICDEHVVGQPLSDECIGDEHVLCPECTVNSLWAGFTERKFPPECPFCKVKVDIAKYRVKSRLLAPAFILAHPALTYDEFLQNYEDQMIEAKKAPVDWDTLPDAEKAHFQAMIDAGELMRCWNPDCGQLFDKLNGCNWVKCYFCQTEHCWQTKKLRHDQFGYIGCGGGHGCH